MLQEFFYLIKADAGDFGFGAVPDGVFEAGGEAAARHGNLVDHFAHGHGTKWSVLADVTQRRGDEFVVKGEVVSRFAWDEFAASAASDFGGLKIGLGDHAVQDCGGVVSKFVIVDLDTGEWRLAGFTDDFVVPDSHDGKVVGAAQAHFLGSLGNKGCSNVGIGENSCGELELLQGLLDKVNSIAPVFAASHHDVGHVLFRPFKKLTAFPGFFE